MPITGVLKHTHTHKDTQEKWPLFLNTDTEVESKVNHNYFFSPSNSCLFSTTDQILHGAPLPPVTILMQALVRSDQLPTAFRWVRREHLLPFTLSSPLGGRPTGRFLRRAIFCFCCAGLGSIAVSASNKNINNDNNSRNYFA